MIELPKDHEAQKPKKPGANRYRKFGRQAACSILREIAEDKKANHRDRLRAIELLAILGGYLNKPLDYQLEKTKLPRVAAEDLLGVGED